MKNFKFTMLLTGVALIALAGCQPNDPPLTTGPAHVKALAPAKPAQIFDRHFGFSRSESTVTQAKYDQNTISAYFKVNKAEQSVNDLKERDLKVTENGINVTPFSISADKEHFEQVADIVFLVDITGTMVEFIETAKKRLKEFILTSRAKGYHTRMCISTFGDYTVKKCSRFFDNNPADPSTEAQMKELMTELAQLSAYKGVGQDPGWPDLDENPMRSLIDASIAPWAADSQRFVILVTDWGFLYLPNREGDKGNPGADPQYLARNNPARMSEVTKAIKDSQMKVFAVTRMQHVHKGQRLVWDGYNTPFQGEPGIVQSSGGEYFDFDKVLRGQISLDQILQRILNRIDTTYKLTYVVDDISGLDPTMAIGKRNVEIHPVDPSRGTVKKISTLSSMPNGRAQYQQNWKVSDNAIQAGSLQVFVDGKELSTSEFSVSKGDIRLSAVPKAGAKIRFVFLYEAIEKNFRTEPMAFRGEINTGNTKVFLNGKEARAEDTVFEKDLEGNSSLRLADSALATNDPYDIRKNQGLTIRVITK